MNIVTIAVEPCFYDTDNMSVVEWQQNAKKLALGELRVSRFLVGINFA